MPRTRVRAGLERALRDAIDSGRLSSGSRLPSSRALAVDLGIARNTVADAYGQLVAEGWLVARRGSGTRVAGRAGPLPQASVRDDDAERALRYDLRPGMPDVTAFPRVAWLAAGRRALNAAPPDALAYGDPRGRPELRSALAVYLARARGVRVAPDRIMVCAGFTQGLAVLCRALRSRGLRTLAVEGYSQPSHRDVAAAAGLRLSAVPVDERGALVHALPAGGAALLTPAHQFPLGVPLAPERRREALEWARGTDALIIEDDYDGEFRYDRQPIGAVQGLDPERIVYAGSASKTLAPGLRLGWLALPADLVDAAVAAKATIDRQSGALDQLALAELIAGGAYDRHVRRSRLAYRRRRDRLVADLRRQASDARVTGIAAGLHALVSLPHSEPEHDVVTRAARHGLALEGLDAYHFAGPRHEPALVVGYGTPPEHAFTTALARLIAVLG